MASKQTNEAIAAYRRLVKSERRADIDERDLHRRTKALTGEEFDFYLAKTQEIDAAVAAIPDTAPETVFRSALNNAGLDA